MKSLLILILAMLLLPALPETLIVKHKDVVLSTETSRKAVVAKGFYVHKPRKYRGGKAVFRMNVKRSCGKAVLKATFRCSTNPGNVLRAAREYSIPYRGNGETVPVEFVLDIPDLDNIAHFNMLVGFRRMGLEKCVWELSDIRFAEYDEGMDRKKRSSDVSEGLPAGLTAARMKEPLELVKNGRINFVIVTADRPDHIARYAAKELQEHFKMACGAAPEIIPEIQYKSGPAIMVGGTSAAKKFGIDPGMLAPENFIVARLGDLIVLSGGDDPAIPAGMVPGRSLVPTGTLYAAYEFLEKTVGFRWYWPGKNGTHIPEIKDLKVNKLYTASHPQYNTRKTFYSIIKNDPDVTPADCEKWYRRNRFGGSAGDPVANHAFNGWIKRFAKTKPEYLALQDDGSRKVNFEPGGGHVCMSNPEVFRQTVADKLAELQRAKFTSFAKVMPGDSNGIFYCKCPDCQKKLRPDMG